MSKITTVHTKHLGETRYRDLRVYYDTGGMNYWDYSRKPKGIYFSSHAYTKSGNIRSWSTGQAGDGYILVVALERYRPTPLKSLIRLVESKADEIHKLIEDGSPEALTKLKALLGCAPAEAAA